MHKSHVFQNEALYNGVIKETFINEVEKLPLSKDDLRS